MIHFEILESPDFDSVGSFEFQQNEIYLGKSNGDFYINDPLLKTSHLMIEVVENNLLIHPQKDVETYLIDGKRATTVRKLKIGQVITIGETKLKIIKFEKSETSSKKKILDAKLAQLIESNSYRLPVIESITKRMK